MTAGSVVIPMADKRALLYAYFRTAGFVLLRYLLPAGKSRRSGPAYAEITSSSGAKSLWPGALTGLLWTDEGQFHLGGRASYLLAGCRCLT